ncbi:LUD domain-containing protein [Robbsia sp. KACC 23696]|uniref:LutC/YkgG family protein n=1 Tax=Robbsia sp. KACC 23696 TaxID=3149231 RepID=UPI00325B369F
MLEKVRRAQPAGKPLPSVPVFPVLDTRSRQERFEQALNTMGGNAVVLDAIGGVAGLPNWLTERFGADARIASAAAEVQGNAALDATIPPAQFANLDVGVVRARFGICETGSVWLSEAEYIVNAIGYLAQHLVVLLDPDSLEEGVQHAYQRDDFKTAKYCVLVTGPSATADIEGVMIRGAQGVRSLTVIWCRKA